MTQLKEFTLSTARPLPVIVLADVSGSMSENGKIEALNDAVKAMIDSFSQEDDSRAEIHVCVITFGGDRADVHTPLTPSNKLSWKGMAASGRTPLGDAFRVATSLIEDQQLIPGRAYRPTLVLVSDGAPTDEWRQPLDALLASERASKATRFALAIGEDAYQDTLKAFLADREARVYEAHEASEIKKYFRWVTMSVTSRSRSINPNSVVAMDPVDLDDLEF